MPEQLFHATAPTDAGSPVSEIRKVRETAERMANGDYPDDADHTRALAGMIHQLAEQVERMAGQGPPPDAPLSRTPPD